MSGEKQPAEDGGSQRRMPALKVALKILNSAFGVVLILVAVYLLFGILDHPGYPASIEKARAAEARSNLKQVAVALKLYADENEGRLPPDLAALVPKFITGGSFFVTTFGKSSETPDRKPWHYYAGHRENDEVLTDATQTSDSEGSHRQPSAGKQKAVIVRSAGTWEGKWLVLYSDFSHAWISEDEFKRLQLDDSNRPAVPARVQEQQH